jgi:hypothetical protein
MRDHLLDIVQHTHGLGIIDLVKITGTSSETVIDALAEDRTVIVQAKFKNPVPEFIGTFGMPNLAKLNTILNIQEYKDDAKISVTKQDYNGESIPAGVHFENKAGDFKNDYRFMLANVVTDKLKAVKFKGVKWGVEIEPSVASIQRLRFMAQANSEETTFIAKVENGALKFYFGDHSSHSGNFVFQHDVGGALTKGADVLAPAAKSVMERFSPKMSEDVAKSRVLQDLERSGMTPQQAGAEWQRMYNAGAPAQLFDVSPALTNRAEVIAQRPGQAGIDIGADVEKRQAGQRGRINKATRDNMGVKGDFYDNEEALTKALRSNADPFYEAAHQAKIPTQAQAKLQSVMDTVKEAYPESISTAKKLYASDGDGALGKFGTKEVSTVPGQSMKSFEEIPEVKQWDYIMRGLYQASTDSRTGSPLSNNALAMRRKIGEILDQDVPAFKSARAVYKGDKEIMEALENGRKFSIADPELLKREWKDMGAGERQAYRVGALKNMRDNIFGSADTSDVTKRVGQNIEDRREVLRTIMPNPTSARLLEESLEAEARLFKNASRITGGPATARRIAGGKDLDSSDFHLLGIAADVAQGKPSGIWKAMTNILSGDVLIPEARANAIGKILRSGSPAEIRSAVNALENFATENAKRQASTARKTVRGAGLVAEEAGEYAGTPDYQLPPLTINRGP